MPMRFFFSQDDFIHNDPVVEGREDPFMLNLLFESAPAAGWKESLGPNNGADQYTLSTYKLAYTSYRS